MFIGNKYRGTTVEKGRSLLIELNNILPPKSVNPSAYLNTHKPYKGLNRHKMSLFDASFSFATRLLTQPAKVSLFNQLPHDCVVLLGTSSQSDIPRGKKSITGKAPRQVSSYLQLQCSLPQAFSLRENLTIKNCICTRGREEGREP